MDSPQIVIPGSTTVQPLWGEGWHWLVIHFPTFVGWLKAALSGLIVISIPLSIAFLVGIIYSVERLRIIRKKEAEKYDLKIEPAFEDVPGQADNNLATRWQKANNLMNSSNMNDWKQAILEADNMLLDVLTNLGYQGDGVGEKLKRAEPGEFKNIQEAWDAHKIRNQIAHDGSFALTHHEAVQTMHKFRKVFEEFYYI